MRIGQRRTTQENQIDQFLTDHLVGHRRQAQVPAYADRDADLPTHPRAALNHEGHLVERIFPHVGRVEPQAEVGEVNAMRLHQTNRHHCVVELHAVIVQVVRSQSDGQWQTLGPDSAHRVQRLEMEANAVFQGAAVFVGADVGQGREETGPQVAMREVHLQPLETGVQGAARGIGIGPVDALDLRLAQLLHGMEMFAAIRHGGRTPYLPAVGMVRRELGAALPGLDLASLAAGVTQLDGRRGAHVLDDGRDAGQALDLGVVVNAAAAGAGAPVGCDSELLGEDQSEPAGGARAEQHDVKIIHKTVDRAVHRHRRHDRAVAQGNALEGVGAEQIGHGASAVAARRAWSRPWRAETLAGPRCGPGIG